MEHNSQKFQWHYTEFSDQSFEVHGRTLFFILVLLILLLILTLIFLYARWACRRHHLTPNNNSISAASTPPRNQGLGSDAIRGLPIVLHKSLPSSCSGPGMVKEQGQEQVEDAAAVAECCICLGAFADGDKVKVLPPCNHCYHPHCVDAWLINHSNCPLCRASLHLQPNDAVEIVVE
ncbi:RING-H2 finger protein ATL66 [Ziziphus jujuba]|uniref:RING-H2 finger protein ATL66 n=1 Tax=Ziziphus jujuba TaxID=326968 RepID=A0ABM3IDF1_ZIZJJ|nr:RING-H2 finger protein ATL66 [Ziziphus jujuba]